MPEIIVSFLSTVSNEVSCFEDPGTLFSLFDFPIGLSFKVFNEARLRGVLTRCKSRLYSLWDVGSLFGFYFHLEICFFLFILSRFSQNFLYFYFILIYLSLGLEEYLGEDQPSW